MTPLSDEQIKAWRCHLCGKCEKRRAKRPYSYEISHDGRPPVTISIDDLDVIECGNSDCPGRDTGESISFDDAATHRITIETYMQLGLLTPSQIRAGRKKLGLKQSELQELLGLGGNSLSRWEKARVYQSRSMDILLRLVFGIPQATTYLQRFKIEKCTNDRAIESRFRYLEDGWDQDHKDSVGTSCGLGSTGRPLTSPRLFMAFAAA